MADAELIATIPLCPEGIRGRITVEVPTMTGIEIIPPPETGGFAIIKIPIEKLGAEAIGRITIPITKDLFQQYYDEAGMARIGEWFWWNREATPESGLPKAVLPSFYVIIPEVCHFGGFELVISGPPSAGGGKLYFRFLVTGFLNPGTYKVTVPQNSIVPGTKIELVHIWDNQQDENENDGPIKISAGIPQQWCTCCMSGGLITEVHGDYGEDAIEFSVDIMGGIYRCKSTDFAQHEVDDWVYVIKTGNNCADSERGPCKDGCAGQPGAGLSDYRIVPMTIGTD